MRDFRELKVWQKAYALTLAVYRASARFPREEQFGLTSQLRRAAASIPANIAEGCGRSGEAELARFFLIAMGSASELECELLLARDLGYLEDKDYLRLAADVTEVKRMLTSFIQKLKADS
jgi:four helix bundle protein